MATDATALVAELHERGYLAEQIVAVTGLSSHTVSACLKGRVEGRHEDAVFHLRVAALRQQALTISEISSQLSCETSRVRSAMRIIRECQILLPETLDHGDLVIDPCLASELRGLHPLSRLLPTTSIVSIGTTPPPSRSS